MTKLLRQLCSCSEPGATGRQQHFPRVKDFVFLRCDFEYVCRRDRSDATARADPDARISRRTFQTIEDCLRAVSHRKHAPVRLSFEFDTTRGKPGDRVLDAPPMQRADKRFCSTRVILAEFFRVETLVGHITAAATGDLDLAKQAFGLLQDQRRPASPFGMRDRAEEASRTAADGDNVPNHLFATSVGQTLAMLHR